MVGIYIKRRILGFTHILLSLHECTLYKDTGSMSEIKMVIYDRKQRI